jgi:exodeoxyribonuclease VII small subunit
MMNKDEINNANFEVLMEELKKTLLKLEQGELPLEDSMSAYEYGVNLVRSAEEKLAKMEGRMEEIMADGSKKELDLAKTMNETLK